MPSIACDDASTHGKFISNVFYTTSNLVNSRRCQDEDGKEMYQNSMEIEKRLPLITTICPPSKTNGALLNFAPRTNKFAVIE